MLNKKKFLGAVLSFGILGCVGMLGSTTVEASGKDTYKDEIRKQQERDREEARRIDAAIKQAQRDLANKEKEKSRADAFQKGYDNYGYDRWN